MKFPSKYASPRLRLESLESRLQPGSILSGSLGLSLLGSLSVLDDVPAGHAGVVHRSTEAASAMSGQPLASLDLQPGPATPSQPAYDAPSERLATQSPALTDLLASSGPAALTAGFSSQIANDNDILFNRPTNRFRSGASQDFPNRPDLTIHCYDHFTVDAKTGWDLSGAFFSGQENGNPDFTVSINMAISTVANDKSLGDVASVDGGMEGETGSITFDLSAAGIHLDPGNYYITVWNQRPTQGGQWFWATAGGATEKDQSIFHNPGGGFGLGTDPINGDTIYGLPQHQAFRLHGSITP